MVWDSPQVWSKKDLLTEAKHVRKKDPSSFNWSPSQRKAILKEVEKRKREGKLSKSAGTSKTKPKKKHRARTSRSSWGFFW